MGATMQMQAAQTSWLLPKKNACCELTDASGNILMM